MSHCIELRIIQLIQELRNPIFDAFFKCLDIFDKQEFFFMLIPTFWLGKDWKTGLRLFYILFLSSLINHTLKTVFLSPRPFHVNPLLGIIQANGYGLPSGAAQTVILLSGMLLTYWNSKWKWCVAFLYTFLVSFARIYLGIHFPTDIAAGWVVGFGLWTVFAYARPPIEKQLAKCSPLSLFVLSQLIPLVLICWQHTPSAIRIGGCAMGMGLGICINHRYDWHLPAARTKRGFVVRALLGITGTFLCYFCISKLPILHSSFTMCLSFFALGLWVATGSVLLCRLFFPAIDVLEAGQNA